MKTRTTTSGRPDRSGRPSTTGIKMLITAAALAGTLGGWATLSQKEAQPPIPVGSLSASAVEHQAGQLPVPPPTLVPVPTLVPPVSRPGPATAQPPSVQSRPQFAPAGAPPARRPRPVAVTRSSR